MSNTTFMVKGERIRKQVNQQHLLANHLRNGDVTRIIDPDSDLVESPM
jgi:hypothetical protein